MLLTLGFSQIRARTSRIFAELSKTAVVYEHVDISSPVESDLLSASPDCEMNPNHWRKLIRDALFASPGDDTHRRLELPQIWATTDDMQSRQLGVPVCKVCCACLHVLKPFFVTDCFRLLLILKSASSSKKAASLRGSKPVFKPR